MFRKILTANSGYPLTTITDRSLSWRRSIFPVRYELNVYILSKVTLTLSGLQNISVVMCESFCWLNPVSERVVKGLRTRDSSNN
jgi:hypothetical protein